MNAPLKQQVPSALRATALAACVLALAGCSSLGSMLQGDKVDYRSSGSKTSTLDVPPDLTQLSRDQRYQVSGGSISATTYQAATPATSRVATASVAPVAIGDMRIERAGNQRWLVSPLPPEQLWPRLKEYWQEAGFNLTLDSPETGILETDWAENRAKLPQDVIRRTLGRVLDSLYSTSEMDRFRTRVERTAAGSEVYISHRGMQEVYTNQQQDQTRWQPRDADPELEAQMLARLMVKLGARTEQAQAAVDVPAAQPRARVVSEGGAQAVQLDEGFDRAWRRVGLSLDRSGFTVEDRDRAQGVYFVRYVAAPVSVEAKEPGFFARLFGTRKAAEPAPVRYRIAVKAAGDRSLVTVLNAQGAPEAGPDAQRIVKLLVDDLK